MEQITEKQNSSTDDLIVDVIASYKEEVAKGLDGLNGNYKVESFLEFSFVAIRISNQKMGKKLQDDFFTKLKATGIDDKYGDFMAIIYGKAKMI